MKGPTPFALALMTMLVRIASAETEYFVQLAPAISDEDVSTTAHALAWEYEGRIRLINLRGFQVEMSPQSVRALAWNDAVESVARYPRALDQAPSSKFIGSARHGQEKYRVWLADSGHRYDQSRVAKIGADLAAQYKATVTGAYAPSIGRPWVLLKATPPMARTLSLDKRVAWIAEEGTPAAAASPDVALEPLPRGPKPPRRDAKRGPPEPARGSLQRVRRHYRDDYFVVLDSARADVSSSESIAALADEVTNATGAQRLGGEFLESPQGFRVSGTEEAALRVAADPRVLWVEEMGTFQRAPEPRPGEYDVFLDRSIVGASPGDEGVRRVVEDLTSKYGGRLTYLWGSLAAFAIEKMSPAAARAMSDEPIIAFVAENGVVHMDVGPAPVIDVQPRKPLH